MNRPVYELRLGYAPGRVRASLAMRAILGRGTRANFGQTNPTVSQHGGVLFSRRPICAQSNTETNTTFRCIMMLCNYFADIFRKAKTPKRQNAQTKPTRCANEPNGKNRSENNVLNMNGTTIDNSC